MGCLGHKWQDFRTDELPSRGRECGLPWAQLILDCFEADENSPFHAETSVYQMSVCDVAAHKSLRKSGSCVVQEIHV